MEELHLSKADNSHLLQVTLATISINNCVTRGNLDSHRDLSALRHLTASSQRLGHIRTRVQGTQPMLGFSEDDSAKGRS